MSTQTDILITYQLTSNSIESLKSVDESEYWKRKLIELLLTRSIHIFPNDENSTQIVYDQISNNRISVFGQKDHPGKRGILSKSYTISGSVLLTINPLAAYYHDRAKQPEFIVKFEKVLQPYITTYTKTLNQYEKGLTYLIIRVFLAYLYDDEFHKKIPNLCTHQKEIRFDIGKRHFSDKLKLGIVSSIKDYLMGHEIGLTLFKKNLIKVSKKNWKFIDDLIAIVFINYFTLFNYQRQELGIALDPDFALINHSCIPNCCQITNDCNEFQIVSTLPINNGEELTVTYVSLGMPREIRQFELFSQFYFRCLCSLCVLDYDPFFCIQCNKCGNKVKSPSFKLILTSPNLIMRQHLCTICLNNLNQSIYPKNIKIRNFFMSLVIFSSNGLSFNNQDYYRYLSKEFVSYIERFTLQELIRMLVDGIHQFEIPEIRTNLVKELMDVVIQDKAFPMYSFPFSIIIRELDLVDSGRRIKSLKDAIDRLRIKQQRLFGVDIPSDLSSMLAFDNCLFLDMADLLFDIIRFIINSDLNPQTDSILGLFNGNSLGVFCQCAFYFYKQVKSIFSEEEIEDKLIEIMEIYDSWVLNHKLTLSECLKAFFELANLNNIVVNDNKMSVKNAMGDIVDFRMDRDDFI